MELNKEAARRTVLSQAGSILGGTILMVESKPFDPSYSDKEKENRLRLSMCPEVVSIKRIPVTSACLEKDPSDNTEVVRFNKEDTNVDIIIPLAYINKPEDAISPVSMDTVNTAIARKKASNIDTYFFDEEALTKVVLQLNTKRKQNLERWINEQVNAMSVFGKISQTEANITTMSLKAIGKDVDFSGLLP